MYMYIYIYTCIYMFSPPVKSHRGKPVFVHHFTGVSLVARFTLRSCVAAQFLSLISGAVENPRIWTSKKMLKSPTDGET